ncbi:MAG: 4-(cytidine 5'-diphospho)-2-C-methyl-D-erythritol kinase [Alphaproteobacteria bacterium]|nr:4-(cytidine 5'-diphospho)-2-C-methyl-D-erythritol kinase [Alphaproteobacteria bacterium]
MSTAPAKLNLFLHLGARRADGYHPVASLIAFAELGDDLSVAPAESLSLAIDGPFAKGLPADETNFVLKAACALAELTGAQARAHLSLTKNLPVAAGLGGGSSDAAAALRALCELWCVEPDERDLMALALRLGADVPICLARRTALVGGLGEVIVATPQIPSAPIVLVNPGIELMTADVFRRLGARRGEALPDWPATIQSIDQLCAALRPHGNDLEAPASTLVPQIAEVLSTLGESQGCDLARMSGSGATCFGIFESDKAAEAAASALSARHPTWWARATRLQS